MSKNTDFSIEAGFERIVDPRTKDYFGEVFSSYANGNMRSAVVGLWSVAVCDILFKLEELRTAYQDEAATKILEEVRGKQAANPKSPDWEMDLVELVGKRTSLLEPSDVENLKTLQAQRHLAAHPVLTGTFELHAPTLETVRALLRGTLEGLLTKPPMMTKKVFDALVEDLAEKKEVLLTQEDVRRYLEAKYLPRLPLPVQVSVFRSLWRLVFKLTDKPCTDNRTVNFRAICAIFDGHPSEFIAKMHAEPGYYSEISVDEVPMSYLTLFLSWRPKVFDCLTATAKVPITNACRAPSDRNMIGWFVTGDLATHLRNLQATARTNALEVTAPAFKEFVRLCNANGLGQDAYLVGVAIYGASNSYDVADGRFDDFILPFLDGWTEAVFDECVKVIVGNSQTYDRRGARTSHMAVSAAYQRVLSKTFVPPSNADAARTFV